MIKTAHANHYLVHETLGDGSSVVIRAIRPEDKPILQEGMHHLNQQSLYFRFFTPKRELSKEELVHFTEVDFIHHVGLMACLISKHGHEIPVGVGRYIMSEDSRQSATAELAFAVSEEAQGRGVGTLLCKHLIKIARAEGLTTLTALVLEGNLKMMAVFAHSGVAMKQTRQGGGVIDVTLSL